METIYRGGTIRANERTAVITFRSGWGDPGEWDIDFYREKVPTTTRTIREEDIAYEDVIKLGLDFTGYDDTALAKDVTFLATGREEIQKESEKLSDLCSRDSSFDSIIGQLRQINNVVDRLSDQCIRVETHIAVYKASKQKAKGL